MIEFIKTFLFWKPKKIKKPLYQIKEQEKRIASRKKRKAKKNTRTN
jgi:hypothetical protein